MPRIVPAVAFVFVALVAMYFCGYWLLLNDNSTVPLYRQFVTVRLPDGSVGFKARPLYCIDNIWLDCFFWPANWLDRALRPHRWQGPV
jgi:hypothetical protein